MKKYTKEEIIALTKEFNDLLKKEMRLKEELLSLKISGPKDYVREKLKRHDEIFAELDDIRMNRMLPLIKEVAAFVRYNEQVRGGVKLAPERVKESLRELESGVEHTSEDS